MGGWQTYHSSFFEIIVSIEMVESLARAASVLAIPLAIVLILYLVKLIYLNLVNHNYKYPANIITLRRITKLTNIIVVIL